MEEASIETTELAEAESALKTSDSVLQAGTDSLQGINNLASDKRELIEEKISDLKNNISEEKVNNEKLKSDKLAKQENFKQAIGTNLDYIFCSKKFLHHHFIFYYLFFLI